MNIDLKGKHILVTGSSRGIGKAIASKLAQSGARVAIHYRKNKHEAEALALQIGNESKSFQADLSDSKQVNGLFEEVIADFGRLDVLVNNAGISLSSSTDLAEEDWLAAWEKTMAVNLTAAALLCKKAILHFQQNGEGRIINISSRAAFRGDTPEYMAYAASKGGMVSLTRSIARGFGKKGIKAFDIAPGFTRTDMAKEFMAQYGEAYAEGDIALNKLTEPDDIAPTVVFLASGLADHATGTTIDINAASYVH